MSAAFFQHKNFTVTTDVFATDLPQHPTQQEVELIAEAYTKTVEKDKTIITKLLYWQDKYPGIPQFKNILSLYYSIHGNNEKAYAVNQQLLQQFPYYLYAKINTAKGYIDNGQLQEALALLGAGLQLSELYPNRKVFHYEEYINYYKTVVIYYCKTGNSLKATEVLQEAKEVAAALQIAENFETEENCLLLSRLIHIKDNGPDEVEKNNYERQEPTLPQTTEAPQFHFKQTELLYTRGFSSMPDSEIKFLLKQDKERLRADLEKVVYDAIKRYQYFAKKDLSNDENSFCLHALYLLKEMKATESLPVVLELLRQPQDLLEHWLFDLLNENIWQVLFTLGQQQTHKLVAFLKEPLNYAFARSEVSIALFQIAQHYPKRRAEIIGIYKELINFYIQHSTDKTIADETFIGLLVSDVTELQATELLPGIKALYAAGIINEAINGSFAEVKLMMQDSIGEKKPLESYFTIKNKIARWEMTSIEQDAPADTDAQEDDEYITNEYFFTSFDPLIPKA